MKPRNGSDKGQKENELNIGKSVRFQGIAEGPEKFKSENFVATTEEVRAVLIEIVVRAQ